MKIFLILILILMFGYIGFCISKSYLDRKRFFNSLLSLISLLKADISFQNNRVVEIFKNAKKSIDNKHLKYIINNYESMLNNENEINFEGLFKNVNLLTTQEKETVYIFFKKLGYLDALNQISMIECFENQSKSFYQNSSDDWNKYGGLYTKLGLIFGCFIALIFM